MDHLWTTPPSLELFGSIGSGLAAVLQVGIKVQRYVYTDIDDAARQVAK
jgi:hypothetical protein